MKAKLADREHRIKAAMVAMRSSRKLVYSEAVRLYNVRRSTLHDHMSKKCAKFTRGRYPMFTAQEETLLVKMLANLQAKGHAITPRTCRVAAYLYAQRCNYHQNLNTNTKMAGRKWFTAFVKRNNVQFIVEDPRPELGAPNRQRGCNRAGKNRLKIKPNKNGKHNRKLKTRCTALRRSREKVENSMKD